MVAGMLGGMEAVPLTNAAGSHAIVVRTGQQARLIVKLQPQPAGRERLQVVPLDPDVEQLPADADALAGWLTEGSISTRTERVPGWASAMGFALIIAIAGLTILGSLTFFGWLFRTLGVLA